MPELSPKKTKILSILVVLFSILTGLLFFEALFGGWFRHDPLFKTKTINVVRNVHKKYDVSAFGFKEKVSTYIRDQYGLRGSCASKNLATMVTVGGSTTNQFFISEGKTWQDLLQKKIEHDLNSKPFCIANAGIDGHSSFGHLASFDLWFPNIENLKPKFFLFYMGINDAAFRFSEKLWRDTNPEVKSDLKNIIKENSILFVVYQLMKQKFYPTLEAPIASHRYIPKNPEFYSAKTTTENIEKMCELNAVMFRDRLKRLLEKVSSYGAKPICVSQPHALAWRFGNKLKGIKSAFVHKGKNYNGLDYDLCLRLLNRELEVLCPAYQGFYINLTDKQFEISDFYDLVHATPEGTEKIASYLFEAIRAQEILRTELK